MCVCRRGGQEGEFYEVLNNEITYIPVSKCGTNVARTLPKRNVRSRRKHNQLPAWAIRHAGLDEHGFRPARVEVPGGYRKSPLHGHVGYQILFNQEGQQISLRY